MGKLIVSEFLTLDGVMEDPGGAESFERGGWAFRFERGAEGDSFKLDETLGAEALLLGRVTYEGFAAAWPERSDPVGFADKMNGMPKYVVSRTLRDARLEQLHPSRGRRARVGREAEDRDRRRHPRRGQWTACADSPPARPRRRAAADGLPARASAPASGSSSRAASPCSAWSRRSGWATRAS